MSAIQNTLEKKELIYKKAELLKAISHPVRLCIVDGLLKQPGCTVNMIKGCLNIPQSTISQHLSKLKAAGIVFGKREGLEVLYFVINEEIKKIVTDLVG